MMRLRSFAACATALAVLSAPVVFAQPNTGRGTGAGAGGGGGMGSGTRGAAAMRGTMYCCEQCKMCYPPGAAQRMGMKDRMGHKLVAYKMAGAGTMGAGGMRGGAGGGNNRGGATGAGNRGGAGASGGARNTGSPGR